MLDQKTSKILLLLAFVLIALSISLFFLIKFLTVESKPEIIKVFPPADANEVTRLPKITITFNEKVSPDRITLSSNPLFEYQLLTKERTQTIEYLPTKLLEGNTTYEISLKFKSGGGYLWNFTTIESEAGALPGWAESFKKQEEIFRKENPPEEVDIRNSIIGQIPYYQDNFWIEYFARRDTLIIHLCQEPYEQTKQDSQRWLNEQGFEKLVKLRPQITWFNGCEPPKIIPNISPNKLD